MRRSSNRNAKAISDETLIIRDARMYSAMTRNSGKSARNSSKSGMFWEEKFTFGSMVAPTIVQ